MIAIINYGLGNLTSISNMFKRIGCDTLITDNKEQIRNASKILLPGVGHFKKGMSNLNSTGMAELLHEQVKEKGKPILGICLGAQLMTTHSQEGDVDGLGWINANTIKFDADRLNGLPVPHMGWADVKAKQEHELWNDLPANPRFYFVHNYHFLFDSPEFITATATYGYEFACAFHNDNIYGAQFHPEKSHKFGMKVLENFSKVKG